MSFQSRYYLVLNRLREIAFAVRESGTDNVVSTSKPLNALVNGFIIISITEKIYLQLQEAGVTILVPNEIDGFITRDPRYFSS